MHYDKRYRYQVITYSHDSGQDEKLAFPTVKKAMSYYEAIQRETNRYYDGCGIWDCKLMAYCSIIGDYPEYLTNEEAQAIRA